VGKDDDEEKREREKRRNQKTFQGYAHPGVGEERPMFDEKTELDDEPPSLEESGELYLPPGTTPVRSLHDDAPMVEIEVVHQHGPAPRMEQPAQTTEVWTQNRIYTCDPSLLCVRVADRKTGRADEHHPFLGFKLVGGQHRDGETFEISYPYPRLGTEAVFEHPRGSRGNFSRTSTVTRVVLRLHVITVAPSSLVPTWSRISQHEIKLPPSKD